MNNYNPLFTVPALWSLLLILSFIGIGKVVTNSFIKNKFGWGIDGAIGIATSTTLGGILLITKLATSTNLMILTIVGVVLFFLYLYKDIKEDRNKWCKETKFYLKDNWIIILSALLILLSWIMEPLRNPADDTQLYYAMSKKILDTGTLIDPFNFRRAATYGGFSFIQSMFHSVVNFDSGVVTDRGICLVILAGILIQVLKEKTNPVKTFIAIAVIIYPLGAINSNATTIMTTLGLALVYLAWSDKEKNTWIILSILTASLLSIRATGGLFSAIILTALLICNKDWKTWMKIGVSSVLLCIPYMILLYKSNGTISMPPFLGNCNPEFLDFSPTIKFYGAVLRTFQLFLIPSTIPILFSYLLIREIREKKEGYLIWGGTIICCLLIELKLGESHKMEVYRYTIPLLLIPTIVMIGKTKETVAIFTIFLVGCATGTWEQSITKLENRAVNLTECLRGNPRLMEDNSKTYQKVQNTTEPNKKILSIVGEPALWDYKRNEIYSLDAPGGCSPKINKIHIPINKTGEELCSYLQELEIDYIAIQDPEGNENCKAGIYQKDLLKKVEENYLTANPPIGTFSKIWIENTKGINKEVEELMHSRNIKTVGDLHMIALKQKVNL